VSLFLLVADEELHNVVFVDEQQGEKDSASNHNARDNDDEKRLSSCFWLDEIGDLLEENDDAKDDDHAPLAEKHNIHVEIRELPIEVEAQEDDDHKNDEAVDEAVDRVSKE